MFPTQRNKERYVLYRIHSKAPVSRDAIAKAISRTAKHVLGTWGTADTQLRFMHKYYKDETQQGIVQVTHTSVEKIKAVLGQLTTIDGTDACVQTLKVSGCLNKLH